ncbi:N-acetyl-1-D-myo-inositol-2-amino-2-deoxy-alpha-D-glucopyranoside deacetylase [Leifsonia sp. YAF41]|uniref:N-acetyl-1-D-myo-inositol-2-amino-2-deoxy-alpha- D-glucopyranoside deacetylase n=1 Tax=Leifsonia sp. YAF41 TaxID=3233086 RepID=UPI003F95658C
MAEQRRILLTHAHPDDESCATGGTIAKYVAEGAQVTVVTSTRGEQGRIAVAELAHLSADQDDLLGDCRSAELGAAVVALNLTDHRYLGAEGRYRDSGRMGGESNDRPDAFWQADLEIAAAELAGVIRETRPHVVVTYDTNGGYGHPDHIQTHRVTMRAIEIAPDADAAVTGEPWDVPKVYWCAVPRDLIQAELDTLKRDESKHPYLWVDTDTSEYPDGVHDDAEITTELDVAAHLDAKRDALAAHRTQLTVHGEYWVLASGRGMRIQDREWFILVKGEVGAERNANGWEPDLFAGLAGVAGAIDRG